MDQVSVWSQPADLWCAVAAAAAAACSLQLALVSGALRSLPLSSLSKQNAATTSIVSKNHDAPRRTPLLHRGEVSECRPLTSFMLSRISLLPHIDDEPYCSAPPSLPILSSPFPSSPRPFPSLPSRPESEESVQWDPKAQRSPGSKIIRRRRNNKMKTCGGAWRGVEEGRERAQ